MKLPKGVAAGGRRRGRPARSGRVDPALSEAQQSSRSGFGTSSGSSRPQMFSTYAQSARRSRALPECCPQIAPQVWIHASGVENMLARVPDSPKSVTRPAHDSPGCGRFTHLSTTSTDLPHPFCLRTWTRCEPLTERQRGRASVPVRNVASAPRPGTARRPTHLEAGGTPARDLAPSVPWSPTSLLRERGRTTVGTAQGSDPHPRCVGPPSRYDPTRRMLRAPAVRSVGNPGLPCRCRPQQALQALPALPCPRHPQRPSRLFLAPTATDPVIPSPTARTAFQTLSGALVAPPGP